MSEYVLPHQHGEPHIEEHLGEKLSHAEDFEIVANLFKLLDDPSRVRIFWLLCHCEECVINISAMVNMTSIKAIRIKKCFIYRLLCEHQTISGHCPDSTD